MAGSRVSTRISSNEAEGFTYTPDFIYSHGRMVRGITRFIITVGFPLNFGENPNFVEFMTKTVNPSYTKVEKKIVIVEAMKEFVNLKKVLHSSFESLSHKIALACDVWRNRNHLKYVHITAHWIDSDWSMERRVINFKMIDTPILGAASISNPVIESVDEWGIKDKTFSVTFDDVCDYPDVTEDLKNVVNPILEGKVFRVRCVCRILSSCIQVGLKLVSSHIAKIRNGMQLPHYVFYVESYSNLCEKYGLRPKLIECDDEDSWDSTRQMLKDCMPYKDVLTEFIASKWPDDESIAISEEDWEIASVYCRFLDVFYEAVDYVSGNYYPSSCGILLHLVNIAQLFSVYRGNFSFKEKISGMEEFFLKHFDRIPDLYCLAAVVDPRVKLSGCECLLESFYRSNDDVNVNVEEEKIKVSNLLQEMYNIYASQFSERQPWPSFGTSGYAWSLISQKKRKTADSSFDELTVYLQTPHEYLEHETKDFDVLAWWKKHEVMYPVIATMARDLLTTPVSTLAPDCAFVVNPENDILGEGYRLRGKILEIYACLRDWFHAEGRTQGERESYDEASNFESED